ncbi:MAG: hypothetical protein QXE80_03460 [Pyrobaculum sp.]
MQILSFVLGTLVVPVVLAVALKINPQKTIVGLANILARYVGNEPANKVTNLGAFFLASAAYAMLVAISDDEEFSEIANLLHEAKERMKKKILKELNKA